MPVNAAPLGIGDLEPHRRERGPGVPRRASTAAAACEPGCTASPPIPAWICCADGSGGAVSACACRRQPRCQHPPIRPNVAGAPLLAGIDLDSGEVTDVVDVRAARERRLGDYQAIMNGIAALAAGEFLLTGKTFRYIRHVRLVADRAGRRSASRLIGRALGLQAGATRPELDPGQDGDRH
jgi:Glutamine cyclotransferase